MDLLSIHQKGDHLFLDYSGPRVAETVQKGEGTTVLALVISVTQARKGGSLQQYIIKSNLALWGQVRVL